jgi:hypothetical protein
MPNVYSAVSVMSTTGGGGGGVLTDVTFAARNTEIDAVVLRDSQDDEFMGIEILNVSDVVIRRKQGAWTVPFNSNDYLTATVAGLTAGTEYRVRAYRGDVSLADI